MKTKTFLGLLLAVTIIFGCSKDEITVTLLDAGNLIINVVNGDTPVSGAKVSLLAHYGFSKASVDEALEIIVTDENGIADFGQLNSGNYSIDVENVEINGAEANPIRPVQVVTGITKEYEVNVPDYVGTFIITTEDVQGSPIAANIAIVQSNDWNTVTDIEDRIALASVTGTSGATGEVSINVPSGFSYYVIAYTEDLGVIVLSDYTFYSYGISVDTEQTIGLILN